MRKQSYLKYYFLLNGFEKIKSFSICTFITKSTEDDINFKYLNMLEKLENLILKNITFISLVFIIIIFMFDLITSNYFKQYNSLSTSQTITFIWTILAFLYWYKKYERDKELENIDKYVLWELKLENIDNIIKWKIAYVNYNRWYISLLLWEIIENNNIKIFYNFLKENLTFDTHEEFINNSENFSSKLSNIFIFHWKNWFMDYMLKILNDLYDEWKKNIENEKLNSTDIEINFNDNLKVIIDAINKTNNILEIK